MNSEKLFLNILIHSPGTDFSPASIFLENILLLKWFVKPKAKLKVKLKQQ